MAGPSGMIKCGWKDCENWFSTGIDMNQHVLINHIKYMKVQFVGSNSATVEPKVELAEKKLQIVPRIQHPPPRAAQPPQHHQNSFIPPNRPPPPIQTFQHFYDDEDDIIEVKPTSSTSQHSEATSPVEPSNKKLRPEIARNHSFEDEEVELDSAEMTPERSLTQEVTPSKKARTSNSTGDGVEKAPWSLARNATYAPDPMIRLTSSFDTVGQMAKAITEELITRKTLRRKNRANGLYCVVCLDYKRDDGLCDFPHNNQQNHFVQYWTTMYGTEQIRKLTIVQQLTEMQRIEDPLPAMTTAYVDPSRGLSHINFSA